MIVVLKKNAFDRWIIVNGWNEGEAWSGSRFVPIDPRGFPAGSVQVSNFATRDEAAANAREHGFVPNIDESEEP